MDIDDRDDLQRRSARLSSYRAADRPAYRAPSREPYRTPASGVYRPSPQAQHRSPADRGREMPLGVNERRRGTGSGRPSDGRGPYGDIPARGAAQRGPHRGNARDGASARSSRPAQGGPARNGRPEVHGAQSTRTPQGRRGPQPNRAPYGARSRTQGRPPQYMSGGSRRNAYPYVHSGRIFTRNRPADLLREPRVIIALVALQGRPPQYMSGGSRRNAYPYVHSGRIFTRNRPADLLREPRVIIALVALLVVGLGTFGIVSTMQKREAEIIAQEQAAAEKKRLAAQVVHPSKLGMTLLVVGLGTFGIVSTMQKREAEIIAQEQAAAEKKRLAAQVVHPSKLGITALPASTPKSEWKQGTMPHLYQIDPVWSNKPYAGDTVRANACGPTSMAMVYACLTGRTDMDPAAMSAFADQNGFAPTGATEWAFMTQGANMLGINSVQIHPTRRTDMDPAAMSAFADQNGFAPTGATEWAFMTQGANMLGINSVQIHPTRTDVTGATEWAFMTQGANMLGINSVQIHPTRTDVENALSNGRPVICSMYPGDFTSVGHFIVLRSIDERGMVDSSCCGA